jgi:putative phosphoesterase
LLKTLSHHAHTKYITQKKTMKRIGLISDTHGQLDARALPHFDSCDEIWHAGDIGDLAVADALAAFRPLRAVYGNIDGQAIRRSYPEDLHFVCEGVSVFMTHIGGYPGRYNKRVRPILEADPPKLFICGHSHILKIMPDKKLGLLHVNPGACGKVGWHTVNTLVRFSLDEGHIKDMEVVEMERRH